MYDGRGQFTMERRVPYKEVVVVISFVSQYTFRHTLFGGRNSAFGFVCMGNRAWVRGSYKI